MEIDNNGLGALYATLSIHMTGQDYDLDSTNVGDAVALSGNNEIDHGSDGGLLLGRLEHVCGGIAHVQIRGVARFNINDSEGGIDLFKGACVRIDGKGSVLKNNVHTKFIPSNARGLVLAVNEKDKTCDVLL